MQTNNNFYPMHTQNEQPKPQPWLLIFHITAILKINDYDTHVHLHHDGCMPRQSLSTHL